MRLATGLAAACVLAAACAQTPPVTPVADAQIASLPFDPPSANTKAHNAAVAATSPFSDTRDFDFAAQGYVGTLADPLIKAADGRVVWDLNAFSFLEGGAPDTVNPSLWRQAQLMAKAGLYQVSDRIWQVRGFDLANATFIKGDTGWIVIDTLTASETAKAAYQLVTEKLGSRPIVAVIYTHSHSDHYAGTAGLISIEDARSGKVQVIAPEGFTSHAVSENIIAGPAMGRRAAYQFGVPLKKGATGTVSSGIGPALAVGTQTLIPPNSEITKNGEERVIDGVRMVFQLTPGTEAPAEMNIGFPDWKVADLAENANATQHNVLTPRGALVRDAKAWANGLTEAGEMFAGYETLIASHGWPRFGADVIADYVGKHRDAYAFLHDQTVRMMNSGLTGDEIAATLKLPKALEQEWYDRPYYGSLSFNSRAVYQRYMGWYDGNPANLAPRPPEETAKRYVAAMGGADKVMTLAQSAYDDGDYAWAAELLNKIIFAGGDAGAAKALLARCYDQLAWQSENTLWRNMYLTGAAELRNGTSAAARPGDSGAALAALLPSADIFNLLSVRLNADKAGDGKVTLGFIFPDRAEQFTITVRNGVLIYRPMLPPSNADAVLTIRRADFMAVVMGGQPLQAKITSGEATISGDSSAFVRFMGWIERPTPNFPIVTP
jgi:alkyl sulfatase BDS1-like metallo-beta-lactamase superfamily hydrolase